MEQYTEQIEVEHINFQNGSMFPFFFNSNGNNNDNNNDNNSYNTSNTANSTAAAAAAASVETPVNLSSNSLSPEQSWAPDAILHVNSPSSQPGVIGTCCKWQIKHMME